MKTKLRFLFVAGLISLGVVFSTSGISYAGAFVTKESTYVTTSASGFNEGPITQKDPNGFHHFEQYDPQKYDVQIQAPLDLVLSVERLNYRKVRVTVRNISSNDFGGKFWIRLYFFNQDYTGESWVMSQQFDIPEPSQWVRTVVAFDTLKPDDGIKWWFRAWANYFDDEYQLHEADYSNNFGVTCRYSVDCP